MYVKLEYFYYIKVKLIHCMHKMYDYIVVIVKNGP